MLSIFSHLSYWPILQDSLSLSISSRRLEAHESYTRMDWHENTHDNTCFVEISTPRKSKDYFIEWQEWPPLNGVATPILLVYHSSPNYHISFTYHVNKTKTKGKWKQERNNNIYANAQLADDVDGRYANDARHLHLFVAEGDEEVASSNDVS